MAKSKSGYTYNDMGIRRIPDSSSIKCQWCNAVHSAVEWDKVSYKECIDDNMRADYRSVFTTDVWMDRADYYYKCPSCNLWSQGNQLVLIVDGAVDNNIGGRPINILKDGRKKGN